MKLRLAYVCLALASSASAFAGPEVRDHRTDAPTVTDHRGDGGTSVETTHYRRRPGPRFMLPLKIDLGAVGVNTTRGYAPGIGAAVGVHWASLSPTPTDTDVGIGVFGALLSTPSDPSMMNTSSGVAYGGAYLEVGHTLVRNDLARVWAAGRGEYLGSDAFGVGHKGLGAMGRISAELYTSGVGIEPRGVFLGTYAIGVYVEAGARDMVDGVSAFQIGGGLTFRTPLVISP
ncbi:MAG: hypothetical protein ABI591_28360 [Kofleriaceae bacterium]